MFTFQILDRGQTLYHPLTDRPIVLGSAATADVRLGEAGVAPAHARLEPLGSPVAGARIQALDGELLVNGRKVAAAELNLGDRIELGRAVLLVGKSVSRPAQPEDVLQSTTGRRRPVRRRGHGPKLVAFAVCAALVGGGAYYVSQVQRPGRVAWDTATLDRLRRAGDFAGARAELAALRARIGDDARLLRHADEEATLLQDVQDLVERRRRAIVQGTDTQDFAELSAQLDKLAAGDEDDATREAAKILRGELLQLIEQRGAAQVERTKAELAAQAKAAVAGPGPGAAARPNEPPAVAPAVPPALAAIAEVDRMIGEGRWAQALQTVLASLEDASSEQAAVLQQRAERIRAAALQDCDRVAEAVRTTARQGTVDAALADLAAAARRFPPGPASDRLTALRSELETMAATAAQQKAQQRRGGARPAEVAAADEAVRRVTLEQLRALMDQIRGSEAEGDFARVAQLQRQGAEQVIGRDPAFAERLRQKAAESDLLAGLQAAVTAAFAAGRKFDVQLRSGATLQLTAAYGSQLLAGDRRCGWLDLASTSLLTLLEQGKLPGPAWLGAATLAYRNGDAAVAETILQKALAADAALKPEVDRAVARGRGEAYDGRGYELQKSGFVAVRTLEARKDAEKLVARLETALRSKDQKVRDAFVTDLLAQGPDALEAVVIAFKKEFQRQLDTLDKSALKKQIDKLAAQRAVLDTARKHALDLIYDEVKYFYPYRPPAVSADKAKEYDEVQLEVDHRVAALRAVWNDTALKVKVPASLRDELDRLDWTARVLSDLAELDASALAAVEWARALPPGESIDVHNFCRTPSERAEWIEWQRIEAANRASEARYSSSQREQVRITNDYRAMYRHRPLAVNGKLQTAANGHAEEMSKLGYFAHFSPTPGRRTPFDRMKLAGYDQGASENIALVDGAEGAHIAWLHSSGHHRNLLNPSHTEVGIGAQGRYWVQNFGNGHEYAAGR